MRLGATIGGETINWTDDTINIAIMANGYVQDVRTKAQSSANGQEHWSDISASEISPTGDYVAGGAALTTIAPYIEATLLAPYTYVVYTANPSTPAVQYSATWDGVSFTAAAGAAIYKVGTTAATSPLLTFLNFADSPPTTSGDKYYIMFGTPGTTLGIFNRFLP